MNKQIFLIVLIIILITISFVLVVEITKASNMGFKLNYGFIQALNSLLKGSGISASLTTEPNNISENTLTITLDLANSPFNDPANSNMGFKLDIKSVPMNGLQIETPDGATYFIQ